MMTGQTTIRRLPRVFRLLIGTMALCLGADAAVSAELMVQPASVETSIPDSSPGDLFQQDDIIHGLDFGAGVYAPPPSNVDAVDLRAGASDLRTRFETWAPAEAEAVQEDGPTLGQALAQLVSPGEFDGTARRAANGSMLNNSDPVLYQDASLLQTRLDESSVSLLQRVFTPTVDENTGQVRFSVFGFGSFNLQRSRDDGSVALAVISSDITEKVSGDDVVHDVRFEEAVDQSALPPGDSDSSIEWLYKLAQQNWAVTAVVFLVVVIVVRLTSRTISEHQVGNELSQLQSKPVQRQSKPEHRVRKRKKRRRSRRETSSRSTPSIA